MPETTTILPCPSCGWSVKFVGAPLMPHFTCTKDQNGYACGYRGPYGEDKSAAISAHNAIASAVADRDRLAAEVERLRAEYREFARWVGCYAQWPNSSSQEEWYAYRDAALAATAPQEAPDA